MADERHNEVHGSIPKDDGEQLPKLDQPKTSESCFVISPFGQWLDSYYREIYSPAIEAVGLKPVRADDLFRPGTIVHDIWRFVTESRVMLADLTGRNPNVFYELGLAHASHKPVLLLAQNIDDVPFDLRSLRVTLYDTRHAHWSNLLQQKIIEGLRETLQSPERAVLPAFLLEDPEQQPSVSGDKKRLLDLQQQIDTLRAEMATLSAYNRAEGSISEQEARAIIGTMLRQGTSEPTIRGVLIDYGAPVDWIERELAATIKQLATPVAPPAEFPGGTAGGMGRLGRKPGE